MDYKNNKVRGEGAPCGATLIPIKCDQSSGTTISGSPPPAPVVWPKRKSLIISR